MRQGQQNRRSRGRGRKGQSPLSRNYESNGPDVKIRGTAAHIAEKYMALARDALSSGDFIVAENYFQHAEHYNRIIMSAQSQGSMNSQPSDSVNGTRGQRSSSDDESVETEEGHAPKDGAVASEASAQPEGNRRRRRRPSNNGSAKKVQASEGNGAAETSRSTEASGDEDTSSSAEEVPPDGAVV